MRTSAFAFVVMAVAASAACGPPGAPSGSGLEMNQTLTARHYTIRSSRGDSVDIVWQDAYYEWLIAALDVADSGPLEYFKYRDRAHLEALTGRSTNGFAEVGTKRFHTVWSRDNHESVHTVVLLHMGHPPSLFTEGIAVAHQVDPARGLLTPRWNDQDLHALARVYDSAGLLPALSAVVVSTDFARLDAQVTYPVSGSFVRYLLDSYGLARMKSFFAGARFDEARATVDVRFQSAYGRSLDSAWVEWRAWLATPSDQLISFSSRARPATRAAGARDSRSSAPRA